MLQPQDADGGYQIGKVDRDVPSRFSVVLSRRDGTIHLGHAGGMGGSGLVAVATCLAVLGSNGALIHRKRNMGRTGFEPVKA